MTKLIKKQCNYARYQVMFQSSKPVRHLKFDLKIIVIVQICEQVRSHINSNLNKQVYHQVMIQVCDQIFYRVIN